MPKKAKTDKPAETTKDVPVTVASEQTDAQKIWDEIKELNLNMFALPNQTVTQYCKPIMIEPSRLYLTVTASAALVALEEALSKKFDITPSGKFIIISRK